MTTMKDEISDIKMKQAAIVTDISWIKKTQVEQNKTLNSVNKKLDSFINSADKIYAKKNRVNEIDDKVTKINMTLAKWTGVVAGAIVVIEFGIKYLLKW